MNLKDEELVGDLLRAFLDLPPDLQLGLFYCAKLYKSLNDLAEERPP
jgi:hypothetical protein